MARNPKLLDQRDEAVKAAFQSIKSKEPKWRYQEWLDHVANEFYLDSETVRKIITGVVRRKSEPPPTNQITIFDEIQRK